MTTVTCGDDKYKYYIADFVVNAIYVAGLFYTSMKIIRKKEKSRDGAEEGFVNSLRLRVN